MHIGITHPNEEQTVKMLGLEGYKFLGWQVHIGNCKELEMCWSRGHHGMSNSSKVIKDKQHNIRGSNCTYWCEECRHFWKIDMSD